MFETKRDFDIDATFWDAQPGRVNLATDIAQAITGEIKLTNSMDVLDFGCGTGLLTMRLQRFVRSITGVDSSQGMLNVLKRKIRDQNLTNVKAYHIDIEKDDILTGSYNLIVSSMTFHHIKKIRPVLDQFYNILIPGGNLCLADLDIDDGQFHENNDGVFHTGFDRKRLSSIIKKAGFRNVHCRTAAKLTKSIHDSGNREFTIFLITGCK